MNTNQITPLNTGGEEALVRAFSPGSTLEPGLNAFRRRGPKCWLETPPFSLG
jgi:hypothetical protein